MRRPPRRCQHPDCTRPCDISTDTYAVCWTHIDHLTRHIDRFTWRPRRDRAR